MLKPLSVLVFFSSFVYPQNSDSLLIQSNLSGFDSTSVSITDSLASDTTKVKETIAKADTLIPIQGQPLSDVSNIISRNTFLFENYRYTGDLLRSFNLNFIKDLGFIGYPNETFIYGIGNGGVSYMLDGVLWNNRFTNSLDLNMVQSEDIDSIEIVPSPRGFLYGPYNNPITVNFITRDFIVPVPYARIKYYQGPNAEAMIDGRFSALLAKRWNLSFEITNRSIDSTYTNTEFSFWQVNAKLKYFLSNSVNITGWYYYVDTKQGLNGGINVDSIANIPPSYNIDMYSLEAPVLYPNQKLDVLQNNFGLRTLAKPLENSKLDFSVIYRYNQDKFTNYYYTAGRDGSTSNKTYGATLNYSYTYDFITLQVLGDYEKSEFESSARTNAFNEVRYDVGGLLSFTTQITKSNILKATLFYKYGYEDLMDTNPNITGLDLKYNLIDDLSIYAGYSLRNVYVLSEKIPSVETGVQFTNPSLYFNLKYFYNEYSIFKNRWRAGIDLFPNYLSEKIRGVGLNLNYKYWILLLETNTSYYFKVDGDRPANLPDWQFVGGLYVNGPFFEDNLDLKTGFTFYYTGEILSPEYEWFSNTVVNPTNKLDFTLAGEIKKVAIFYFIWENIYYNQYYITPYYPMPDGNIRFGIAWELFN